ncbi:hypothetical protein CDAR_47461 [Caerostris darwini]|uniref:Uncharacterized protein n=1 Tax=Caerostris darwini TaxID=1538125 RepID=A0AAV4M8Z4_9ARAC|nr:hypothetical protein CDAR_47461 [Caerostris darwini]
MSGKQAFAFITTANMKKVDQLEPITQKRPTQSETVAPENKIHLIKGWETILQIAFEFRESDENLQIEKKKTFARNGSITFRGILRAPFGESWSEAKLFLERFRG